VYLEVRIIHRTGYGYGYGIDIDIDIDIESKNMVDFSDFAAPLC
tara:strand:- start:240 stop:371 length:132 start_codon:yes stop_codon:yes gene_type:complete